MTKKEQQESLFSLNIIHGYIKHYALQEDYDRDHCLMHLKSVVEILERDRVGKEEDKPQLAFGIYNNIKDKDTIHHGIEFIDAKEEWTQETRDTWDKAIQSLGANDITEIKVIVLETPYQREQAIQKLTQENIQYKEIKDSNDGAEDVIIYKSR